MRRRACRCRDGIICPRCEAGIDQLEHPEPPDPELGDWEAARVYGGGGR